MVKLVSRAMVLVGISLGLAGAAIASDADVLQQAKDRAEIEHLMWRYARALDTFDEEAYASVYTEDGQFVGQRAHALFQGGDPAHSQALHPPLNAYWRDAAARHPENFTLIDLGDELAPEELVHAHHYVPSALQRITGMIDDWYDAAPTA